VLEPNYQTRQLDVIELDYEINDIAANSRDNKVWLTDYPTVNDILMARLALESQEPSDLYQIRLRSTGEAIGSIGFKGERCFDDITAVEIQYEIAPSIHGQGLGTDAVAAIRHVARTRGIQHLCAQTDIANKASQEVLKKNRFEEVSRNDNLIVWLQSSQDA
jgi:RimJ/RimL family protein N-acetyltransferase